MCDCLSSTPNPIPLPSTVTRHRKFGLTQTNWSPQNGPILYTHIRNLPRLVKSHCRNPNQVFGSEEYGSYGELGFKEEGGNGAGGSEAASGLNILELKGSLAEGKGSTRNEESEEQRELVEVGKKGLRKGRQMVRRSNLVAKQVISVRSALSLGFVSELWVDTTSWVVLFVQVRPNLLSGESESFLLEDVSRVGDVVLVQDESVLDNEFKMVGLETLVGYKVVTPGRRNIGKVRGYSFNINSGAIESLELDSFGISIIPSSLVSTYALFVEDVLEVLPDAVVVHEAAASRIQRLTKGFLGTQNVGASMDELGEYADLERPARSEYKQNARRYSDQRFRRKNGETEDDWELPMDYL